jgi:hypothetical protein
LLPAGFAAIAGLLAFVVADASVSRERLTKFANRHDLLVTTANAPHLVRYLALTRRWRAGGAVAGLTAYLVAGLQHQTVGISLLYGLAGWFAGAIVAEVRATTLAAERRVASLEPRSVTRYVTPHARTALAVATVLCLVAAGLSIDSAPPIWLRPLVAAIVLPALVMAVVRRIAVRAQPLSSADVIAADEAIRRNSSQALYAAATTLLLFVASGPLLGWITDYSVGVGFALALLLLPAIPTIGWRLGRIRDPR